MNDLKDINNAVPHMSYDQALDVFKTRLPKSVFSEATIEESLIKGAWVLETANNERIVLLPNGEFMDEQFTVKADIPQQPTDAQKELLLQIYWTMARKSNEMAITMSEGRKSTQPYTGLEIMKFNSYDNPEYQYRVSSDYSIKSRTIEICIEQGWIMPVGGQSYKMIHVLTELGHIVLGKSRKVTIVQSPLLEVDTIVISQQTKRLYAVKRITFSPIKGKHEYRLHGVEGTVYLSSERVQKIGFDKFTGDDLI